MCTPTGQEESVSPAARSHEGALSSPFTADDGAGGQDPISPIETCTRSASILEIYDSLSCVASWRCRAIVKSSSPDHQSSVPLQAGSPDLGRTTAETPVHVLCALLKHASPWFRRLCELNDENTATSLLKCLKRAEFQAQERLFHQGEEVGGAFFLVQGRISLHRNRDVEQQEAHSGWEQCVATQLTLEQDKFAHIKEKKLGTAPTYTYTVKVGEVHELGSLVGENYLEGALFNSPGLSVGVFHAHTAIAETEAKLLYLDKGNYRKVMMQRPVRGQMRERIEIIERIPLFANLVRIKLNDRKEAEYRRNALEFIAGAITAQHFSARTTIAQRGDNARLCIILRGNVAVVEGGSPEENPSPGSHVNADAVVQKPPNRRDRKGKIGLRQRANISHLEPFGHFGLNDALSQCAHFQDTYVASTPTDVIWFSSDDARRMLHHGWLSINKADLERIGTWHDKQLQDIKNVRHSIDDLWGRSPYGIVQPRPGIRALDRQDSSFHAVSTTLWGSPPGGLGLPLQDKYNKKHCKATPSLRPVVVNSNYANPNAEEFFSPADAIWITSQRLNPDMKLRLTPQTPVSKTIRRVRPRGARDVPGTDWMLLQQPIKVPMLDLHKVRQGRRRKGVLSERQAALESSLKQAIIHRYRTADGVDRSERLHPSTAAGQEEIRNPQNFAVIRAQTAHEDSAHPDVENEGLIDSEALARPQKGKGSEQKISGFQPEKSEAQQLPTAGSAPVRHSSADSRGYRKKIVQEGLAAVGATTNTSICSSLKEVSTTRTILTISNFINSEDIPVEDVMRKVFRWFKVKFMALYENVHGAVTKSVLRFEDNRTAAKAFQHAKDLGFEDSALALISEQEYQLFHMNDTWKLEGMNLTGPELMPTRRSSGVSQISYPLRTATTERSALSLRKARGCRPSGWQSARAAEIDCLSDENGVAYKVPNVDVRPQRRVMPTSCMPAQRGCLTQRQLRKHTLCNPKCKGDQKEPVCMHQTQQSGTEGKAKFCKAVPQHFADSARVKRIWAAVLPHIE